MTLSARETRVDGPVTTNPRCSTTNDFGVNGKRHPRVMLVLDTLIFVSLVWVCVRRANAMATTAPTAAPSPAGGNVLPPKDEPTPEEARSAAEAAAELQKAHVALLTKEVERVGKKQRVARDKAVEVVDALLAEVRAARERLERTTDAGERSAAMNELRASLMEKDYPAQVRARRVRSLGTLAI